MRSVGKLSGDVSPSSCELKGEDGTLCIDLFNVPDRNRKYLWMAGWGTTSIFASSYSLMTQQSTYFVVRGVTSSFCELSVGSVMVDFFRIYRATKHFYSKNFPRDISVTVSGRKVTFGM